LQTRVRSALPSPQVVLHVLHAVQLPHVASTRQHVAPELMSMVCKAAPGHAVPPHVALHERVREMEFVCVTQLEDHGDQPPQTPLTALTQQLLSTMEAEPGHVLVQELA